MSVPEKHPKDCLEDEDDEEEVDPRIQIELNRLNEGSNEINKYENQLDEARSKYRTTLSESSQELKNLARNKRKTISRARAYYELKVESKRVQEETIRAAGLYQMANSIYRAAKETIMLAEEKLTHAGQTAELSAAWQEMLNHATIRVMDAEREKRTREEEHHETAKACAELELKMQMNEKLYKKSIEKARFAQIRTLPTKSSNENSFGLSFANLQHQQQLIKICRILDQSHMQPYFEKKGEMEQELEHQKQKVIVLQDRLQEAKAEYSGALKNLEQISEEVHERRKSKAVFQYPREPGVGAETKHSKCLVTEMNMGVLESDGECSSETSSTDERTEDTNEKYRDLVDHMDSSHFPRPGTPLPLQQTPPTTPIFPSDSPPTLTEFPGFVSPPSYTVFPSSSSSPSTSSFSSVFSCPPTSPTTSSLSQSFSSVSLNQTSSSMPASPDDEKPWSLTVSPPPLENRSVEGALNLNDERISGRHDHTNKMADNKNNERENAPIKIFTAFREIFLSKPIVRSGAKLERRDTPKIERQDTSEDDISI